MMAEFQTAVGYVSQLLLSAAPQCTNCSRLCVAAAVVSGATVHKDARSFRLIITRDCFLKDLEQDVVTANCY